MPFMHAENVTATKKCVELFSQLTEDCDKEFPGEDSKMNGAFGTKFAQSHSDIVEKFGRYPARNKALGREDTEEEKSFNGPRFGQ